MKKPIDGFDACEDFFTLVIEALVLVACMGRFKMQSVDDVPCAQFAPKGENTRLMSKEDRKKLLDSLSLDIVDTFSNFAFHSSDVSTESTDKVFLYTKYLLSLGFFYFEFSDAIREGDGARVLRCWRYMLPMFISSGRKNYAIESFQLLMQHDYLLSEREAAELMWSRFINVRGYRGCNIPNDKHMEHLNRICKTPIKALGANKTAQCITRVGEALGTIAPVIEQFDRDNNVPEVSGLHHVASSEKDLKLLIDVLKGASVFVETPPRQYPSFSHPKDPLHKITKEELTTWIEEHVHF